MKQKKDRANPEVQGHILKFLKNEAPPRGKACFRPNPHVSNSRQFPLLTAHGVAQSGYLYHQPKLQPLSGRNFITIASQGAAPTSTLLRSDFSRQHKQNKFGREKGLHSSFLDNNRIMKQLSPFHGLERTFVRQQLRQSQLKQKLALSGLGNSLMTLGGNMFSLKNTTRRKRQSLAVRACRQNSSGLFSHQSTYL